MLFLFERNVLPLDNLHNVKFAESVLLERYTGLEPVAFCLASRRSTKWANTAYQDTNQHMQNIGIEPIAFNLSG